MRPDRLAIPSLFFTFLFGSFIALALTGPRDAAAKIFDPETFTGRGGLAGGPVLKPQRGDGLRMALAPKIRPPRPVKSPELPVNSLCA